jgi:hypothetical protein
MNAVNVELVVKLQAQGENYSDYTEMPDGSLACVCQFAFTYAILSGLTDWGYHNRWCYHDKGLAQDALEEWKENYATQTEPTGWHRHPATGRRVREDGTMYVNL